MRKEGLKNSALEARISEMKISYSLRWPPTLTKDLRSSSPAKMALSGAGILRREECPAKRRDSFSKTEAMRHTLTPPCAAANPAIASLLQLTRPVRRVADLGR